MADNKKKSSAPKTQSKPAAKGNGTSSGRNTGKSTTKGAVKPASKEKKPASVRHEDDMKIKTLHGDTNPFWSQLTPYIIGVVAVFVGVCIYAGGNAGIVGGWIRSLLLGLSGGVAYVFPVLLLMAAVKYTRDRADGVVVSRNVMVGVICILLSVLFHIFMAGPATFNPADHWKTANEGKGGGVLGGMLGHLMMCAFDKMKPGTIIMNSLISDMMICVVAILFPPC